MTLERLLTEIRACTLCADRLPLGPRPIVQASATARLLLVGQAPGRRVHVTGLPFNDPSGDLLRRWLGIDRDVFYDPARIAILPTGLCYPGRDKRGGDAPPLGECAPLWHPRLRSLLGEVRLTLLIGRYAQAYYLGNRQAGTLTGTVRRFRDYLPDFFPIPHPSPRNRRWLALNPWFEAEIVPKMHDLTATILSGG